MKKILPLLLITALLAGCQLPGSTAPDDVTSDITEPTMTDIQMSTRVAQILTSMPTPTKLVQQQIPTATKMATQAEAAGDPTSTQPADEAQATPTTTLETSQTEEATPEASATPSASPTITETPTPIPTAFPEGDPRNSLGDPDWKDELNDGAKWPIDEDAYSIGKIENGSLVMVGKKKSLSSWRLAATSSLTDVYIEAHIKIDNCTTKDGYGLFFRVPNIKEANRGYLFGITCDGNYYLRKWNGATGAMTKLIDYTPSNAIYTESNQTNRIGIMAVGQRLMFYINGTPVSEYTDNTYSSGHIGLFVQPMSTVPLTIRLDEISYWTNPTIPDSAAASTATATLTPTPTATGQVQSTESAAMPSSTPDPSEGTLIDDAMNSATDKDITLLLGEPDWHDTLDTGTFWPVDEDSYSKTELIDSALEMTNLTQSTTWRLANTRKLNDVYTEVTFNVDTCTGGNGYGIFFRSPKNTQPDQGYLFGVTCDGKYFIMKWDGKAENDAQKMTRLTYDTAAYGVIESGSDQTNRVGVMAVDKRMQLYVNGEYVYEISDDSYDSGYFGVFLRPESATSFTVKVDEASYWID